MKTNRYPYFIFLFAFSVLLIVSIFFSLNKGTQPIAIPSPTLSQPMNVFCMPSELKSTVFFQGAAGNIYGQVTLQNISRRTCMVFGNGFIQPLYNAIPNNVTVIHNHIPAMSTYSLTPHQTLYSLIHYPNGAECSTGTHDLSVSFQYTISHTQAVMISDGNNLHQFTVPACNAAGDILDIDIYAWSTQPVTP